MLYVVSVTHHQASGESFTVTVHVEADDPVAAVEVAVNRVRTELGRRGLVQDRRKLPDEAK